MYAEQRVNAGAYKDTVGGVDTVGCCGVYVVEIRWYMQDASRSVDEESFR